MTLGATAPTPGTVVFDLGGVLIDWSPHYLYRQLLAETEIDEFLDEIGFYAWNREQDSTARPWAEAVAELAERHPHRRELIAAYPERFRDTLSGPIDETVQLLHALHARDVRLLALTNWSAEMFAKIRGDFDFLELFEGIVVSGEEQVAKPDPKVFALLLDRFALTAAETVFIDDSAPNVAAAAELGMVGLHFRDAPGLRADLTRLRLLSDDGGSG